ncbi:nucleolar protein 8 isoform X3 [Pelodiscus sinensis]|uniref:nucleolar protein 8 isoform X3 n=1 Tax=Pelodiscus sinensis TaxID=13735 RepID=UPI003F6C3FC5
MRTQRRRVCEKDKTISLFNMEKIKVLKRLYVGGLGHTVSEAELQERFSKFGNVTDVEIVIRKDEQGNPMKTFAYISISISEVDLKRCMSILNKARWKGGTLQIELAKESFLHRLAQERQEARLKKEKPYMDGKANLLESLNKAGVVNFHMKAVPGTEVPDHKDWVVSKFGRVLPILHLKSRYKSKIVKYDPSKYCHNLRKLEQDLTDTVPISKLTWQLEGGYDSMSKKRRGEFSEIKKTRKKIKLQNSEGLNKSPLHPTCNSQTKKANLTQTKLVQMSNSKSIALDKLLHTPNPNSLDMKVKELFLGKNLASGAKPNRNTTSISDSDIDSEEEIRAVIERERKLKKAKTNVESENDHLEVVGDNFELKYNTHWCLTSPSIMKEVSKRCNIQGKTNENYSDYDSADTDEIIAVTKAPDENSVKTKAQREYELVKMEGKDNFRNDTHTNNKCDSVNDSFVLSPDELKEKNNNKAEHNKTAEDQAPELQDNIGDSTSGSTGFDSDTEASESDSDYENMMQNCYHLNLTLHELEALATESIKSSDGKIEDKQRNNKCRTEANISNTKYGPKSYEIASTTKKSINPEDIVASILEGEESDDDKPVKNTSSLKFQPFRGLGLLCENGNFESLTKKDLCSCKRKCNQNSLSPVDLKNKSLEEVSKPNCSCYGKHSAPRQSSNSVCLLENRCVKKKQSTLSNQLPKVSDSQYSEGESEKFICKPPLLGENNYLNFHAEDQTANRRENEACTTATESEEESTDTDSTLSVAQKHIKCELASPTSLPEKPKKGANSKSSETELQKNEINKKSLCKSKDTLCVPITILSESNEKEKQLQDNQKRLAALQERLKERELQKKLIQGALLNLDSQSAKKHKHIVFDSDGESEPEVEEKSKEEATIGNLGKGFTSKISGKLFESSEDEQDAAGEDDRFEIKPQFEGKAGEKLMRLQSRFGTDERFRMDVRFLESDSEEEEETKEVKMDEEKEIAAEKKKNLEILGSLLQINLQHPKSSKLTTNIKKFKDINTLRYDPTRQDHAVFERKTDTTEKESKAKRKKKREEAEKLPEVSKEIYYDVAVDLKEAFGSVKCAAEKSEVVPWDKHDDVEESTLADEHTLKHNIGDNAEENSSGFTFSFFGDDMNKSAVKEEPYVIETIRPAKVSWQEDPRFQDSSSEEDEPEASESENFKDMSQSLPQIKTSRFFFFSRDDERLKDGPKLFCRSSNLNEEKDNWENRCRLLLEECRKKHKDARRKVKTKQYV